MNCVDAENLICDYATLTSAERFELERHLGQCAACAELARDSAAALRFIQRAADVEPPPELITRILFDAPWSKQKGKSSGARSRLAALLTPILQPRFAMGMAMTILSLSMLARFVAPVKQLKPADLEPAAVWAGLEDRAVRAWARSVKFYENLKFVYQIQTTLRDWQQQAEESQNVQRPAAAQSKTDDRKLPVKTTGPGQDPGSKPSGGSR
jgi:hypothetical protein